MLIFVFDEATAHVSVFSAAMETDGEQNQQGASTNGSTASGTSSRPSQMNSMSLYERQAVQVGVCSYCPATFQGETLFSVHKDANALQQSSFKIVAIKFYLLQ